MSDYFIHNRHALDYSKAMIPKMCKLSTPLFDNTKVTNFSYLRFNKDGTILNLTTEEKWIQFRFEQKIKYRILFKDHLTDANYAIPYTYLWPKNTEDVLLRALYQYNIWNGCNIYITHGDYIEVYSFASSTENENMQNFYINNLDLLRHFILFFKEAIDNTFEIHLKKNLISTDLKLPASNSAKSDKSLTTYDNLYDRIKVKRVHLTQHFYLTKSELSCCAYLMRGDNIKTIAQKTKLSPRTVESHINNAKLKANCSTKAKLIDIISNNRWIFDSLLHN